MPASRIQPSTLSVAARACGERNTRVSPPASSECCASNSQRSRILSADSMRRYYIFGGMAGVPYEDEIIISWVELHRDARYLSEELHKKGPWKGIIAVTRGGLVPAALVARELDIRLVDTVCVTSYDSGSPGDAAQVQGDVRVLKGVAGDGEGYLLIDDLVDTGRT